jgi:hypothetical protein
VDESVDDCVIIASTFHTQAVHEHDGTSGSSVAIWLICQPKTTNLAFLKVFGREKFDLYLEA